ncbi:zinc finger protein 830 [Bombina bombina]|uniref:zinc finger protein 830 n=1 Tax=Bombina bombina TaxID=8345 RepID=UPI00235AE0D9|nr:zinc finger protein 830 [Bombina bombina]
MAASGKKKLVQQEELRRLMKAKQRETAVKKRIESPLAKYNSLGQLSCVVCNAYIKSELLWQAHILGKQHKEKVAELKGTKADTSNAAITAPISQLGKRKVQNPENNDHKRIKAPDDQSISSSTSLPSGFFDKEDKSSKKQTTAKTSSLSLLVGDYDDDDIEDNEEGTKSDSSFHQKPTEIPLPPPAASNDSLPADFFDNKTPVTQVSHSGSILKPDIQEKVVERKENTAEALPEGFFDDPEIDAKIRKVDAPKDQMDKEWDEFQKEIRQVNTVSEAIVAEEDEEGRLDRQIDEIDEQIECYRRIEQLRDRKENLHESLVEIMRIKASKKQERDEVDSDDEGMLKNMLAQDWREKGAFL